MLQVHPHRRAWTPLWAPLQSLCRSGGMRCRGVPRTAAAVCVAARAAAAVPVSQPSLGSGEVGAGAVSAARLRGSGRGRGRGGGGAGAGSGRASVALALALAIAVLGREGEAGAERPVGVVGRQAAAAQQLHRACRARGGARRVMRAPASQAS